jgi:hypothetical protein
MVYLWSCRHCWYITIWPLHFCESARVCSCACKLSVCYALQDIYLPVPNTFTTCLQKKQNLFGALDRSDRVGARRKALLLCAAFCKGQTLTDAQ